MARSQKEAIILVLDVGASASKHVLDDGSTFLDTSKKCIERIIERKIFSSAGDEIGLVLLGSEVAANALQYAHISEGFRMANPSWEMLKIIKEINGTNVDKCDWIDALVVAMDVLQTQTEGKKFTAKKIVLFVDPDNDVCDDKLDNIINGIKKMEVEMTAIGVDLFQEDNEEQDELKMNHDGIDDLSDVKPIDKDFSGKSRKERGEALLGHIITECEGISCNFKDALSQLKTYQLKAVRPTPWNVTLDIGHSIKIPVAAYKKIAPATLPTWQKTVRETPKKFDNVPDTESQSSAIGGVRLEQDRVYMRDDRTVVEKEDRIAGYYFGTSTVPFNEYDNEQMKYKSGEKCLNVLGFARFTDIPRRYFIGEGVYYLFHQKKFPESQQPLSAFIRTLYNQQKVAIATKVFRKDCAPNLVALFPLLKKKYECLLLVELPFSEDVNEFVFPHVVSEMDKPTEEELAAVDSLIDTMDLTEVNNGNEKIEAFRLKDTVDPALMHQFRCISYRAFQPDKPLPPIFEDIKEMMDCPFQSQAKYKLALDAVKDKFRIVEQPEMTSIKKEISEKSKKHYSGKDNIDPQPSTSKDQVGAPIPNASGEITMVEKSLVEVGSVKPHEDFLALVARGENFKAVCDQMQKVILKLVLSSFGSDSFPKALLAVSTLRKSCVEKNPKFYNDWLPGFKTVLNERDKMMFWELVAKESLGLITSEENPSSSVSQEEAGAIFREPEEASKISNEDELDIDDLIDEM